MSILITYSTKYGFTKMCAQLLAKKFNQNVELCDLKHNNPDISQFDKIIIGGSIYAGRIRKPVSVFCNKNKDILKEKKIGLFICGLAEKDDAKKQLEACFPKELLDAAVCKECFGGEYDFNKMNFMERTIIKKISGSDKNQSRLNEENINYFVEQMKNA